MRIGFFADEYLPRVDGVITSMLNSAEGLRRRGHQVWFIVPAYPGVKSTDYVIRVPSTPAPLSDNLRAMLPSRTVRQTIAGLKLDIIHSHTPFAAGLMARRAASELDLPHVATFHTLLPVLLDYYPLRTRTYLPAIMAYVGDIMWSSQNNYTPPASAGRSVAKRWAWRLTGAYVDSLDYVISPSQHFAELIGALGVTTPVSRVPNSLDLTRYQPASPVRRQPVRLIAVGRLSPEKRQLELIKAMTRVSRDTAHLTLVGDGPERTKLERAVTGLGVSSSVKLTGQLSPAEVAKQLGQSDAGVLASYGFDNQPMTMLEYLAAGLPILYCDPNLSEVVGPEAGLLVKPEAASLAGGIKRLSQKFLLRKSLSYAALAQNKQYSHLGVAKQLESVYNRLLA